MLEELKKNWFALVVALALFVASGFYIADQSRNKVKAKKVDGQQVVFSINKENYLASEFQDDLYDSLHESALFQIFRKQVLTSLETSEDNAKDAQLRADSFIAYIKQSEGQKGLDAADKDLMAMGYDGIDELSVYYENELKYNDLITDLFMENYDELFKKDFEANKPRLVTHILVKMDDPSNPTEEELEKIKTIEEALETGEFEEVAMLHSDDTQSAQQGGSIGVVDKESSLDEAFSKAMLKLKKDETSEWVTSQFGQHLIKVNETEFQKLLKDPEYFSSLETEHKELVGNRFWQTAEKLNLEFADKAIEDSIKNVLGIKEAE